MGRLGLAGRGRVQQAGGGVSQPEPPRAPERGLVVSAEEPEEWYTASDGQESRARLSAMLPTAQINRTWVHPSTVLQRGDVWNHSRIPRPPLSTCSGPGTHGCLLYGRARFIFTREVSTVMSLGLPMGRQVHREGPVPGHTSGKLPGKINRGARLLVPGSRDTDRKNSWSPIGGVGGGRLPGIPWTPQAPAALADPE